MSEQHEGADEGIAYTLHGDNEGDLLRAAILKDCFVDCLLDDPRVVDLFAAWRRQTGLDRAAADVTEAKRRYAAAVGTEHFADLEVVPSVLPLATASNALVALCDVTPPEATPQLMDLPTSLARGQQPLSPTRGRHEGSPCAGD